LLDEEQRGFWYTDIMKYE